MALNVYFVDDEEDLCQIFSEIFASDKVHIRTFTDPVVAIAEIKKNAPDLLFVDFRLPGMTGDDIVQTIDASIPTVLLTGDLMVKTNGQFLHKYSKTNFPWDEITKLIQSFVVKKPS